MKRQITFAILLLSSLGAFAQVTQEELETKIKPLTEQVKTLQKENGSRKSEIGTLTTKLKSSNDSIEILKQKNSK